MANLRTAVTAPFRLLAQVYKSVTFTVGTFVHGPTYYPTWPVIPGLAALGLGNVRAEDSSIVVAAVRWIQRTFTEAPPLVDEWLPKAEEWRHHPMDEPILDLLERPNPFYSGATLWKATLADRIFSGISYWIKVRGTSGRVVQLWWAPAATITPVSDDPADFISRYVYRPGGGSEYNLPPGEVIRFPDGIDPANPRLGMSPVRTLLREIYTDDEASIMTAALLKNMGIPGVIISPKAQGQTISQNAAEAVKKSYTEKFTGGHRGEPLVLEGSADVVPFGFSPQQLELRAIRGLPEERITAVLGINAAVLGLGAGLETTKVGATLREYREEAFESSIIPMYRELSADLTMGLLPDFYGGPALKNRRMNFDLSKIRVLQDDEVQKATSLGTQLLAGGIKISEYRRALGYQVLPEHDVYLRPKTHIEVAAGEAGQTADTLLGLPATIAPAAPASNGNGAAAALTRLLTAN